jgi:diguanylate cyclase (GGDEF)-like protein
MVLFTSLFLAFYFFQQHLKQSRIDAFLNSQKSQNNVQLKVIRDGYSMLSQTIFENMINTSEISLLIQQANNANESSQKKLRAELYSKLLPLYQNLQLINIRQLHFHLKENTSFLRFHRPQKFGDSLKGIRYSIDYVNKTHKMVQGFEEGRVYNGFRNVFPLFVENNFVGTVEISYDFSAIRNEAIKSFQAEYRLLIKKDVVTKKVWEDERNNYKVCKTYNGYLHDKITDKNIGFIPIETIHAINDSLKKEVIDSDFSHELYYTTINNTNYLVTYLRVYNVAKKHVAYLVSYTITTRINEIHEDFINNLYIAFFTLFILLQIVIALIDYNIRSKRELHVQATTDGLTQIANRSSLNTMLTQNIEGARRHYYPLSLIFFDIDFFKKINDTYGHNIGDQVLIEFSITIQKITRKSDLLARWGGEEFIVALPHTTVVAAQQLAEKFRKEIEGHNFKHGVHFTCSFGVTQFKESDNFDSFVKRADEALYYAKDHGRNRVHCL